MVFSSLPLSSVIFYICIILQNTGGEGRNYNFSNSFIIAPGFSIPYCIFKFQTETPYLDTSSPVAVQFSTY